MYNESYDEYIRSILGYPRQNMTFGDTMYDDGCDMQFNNEMQDRELEDCYPEIYRIVYPMVESRCRNVTQPITRELVDSMTNEIYLAIEGNEEVQININLGNTVRATEENRNLANMSKKDITAENRDMSRQQGLEENRQRRPFNRNLNDLIRILIIRELLRRRRRRPGRPPMRPPFPGRPPRPPMRPRYIDNRYDWYESDF